MAQFELNFAQDLKQKISIRHCETMVFTKDNLSNAVRVELFNGSEPYSGGGTVSATAVRSDGITVPITNGSITGNVVTVYLTEAAVDVPGNVGLYVKLTSGDTRTTVLAAIFAAQRTETDSTIDPGTIIPSVTDLINAIDEAVDSIPPDFASLLAGIAPVFSASADYLAGAFVWKEGVLYRFTTAHPAGSWTGSDVVTASMGADFAGEISDLKSQIGKAVTIADSDSTSDLDITDGNGNVIFRLASGDVETKNFRSFDFITYASPSATYNGAALTLTVPYIFKKGDRVVLHMERGAKPWDYGAYVSYYENSTAIKENWRGDCAWIEYTIKSDTATISATYAANAVGMTSGSVRLEVSLLGNMPIIPKIVSVKQDGSGDYTTLRGAIDAIGTSANDVLNPYRIEIYPGTYDVMGDYTDEEIAAAAYDQTSFVGPKLLNGMYLVGIGNPGEVVLNGELSTAIWSSSIRGVVSTLNAQGSCGMENLTVIARNLRYCVHADYHTPIMKKPKQTVKDCIFRGYNISYNPGTTFGAGTSDSGCDFDFINCDFGENGGVHTLPSTKARSFIHCVDCKGHGFRIGDQETSNPVDGYSMYTFDNCDFLWINYAMAGSVPHAKVRGCCGNSPLYQFPASVLYDTGDVVAMRNGGFGTQLSVGKAAEWFSNVEHGPRFQPATSAARVVGICVYKDADDTYIQTKGYVRADRTNLTGYSIGDYIGLSGGNLAIVQSSAEAFGKIAYVDNQNVGYIKLGVN